MPSEVWANEYFYLPSEMSNLHGRYSSDVTPYMSELFAALDDKNIEMIVAIKSAQIAWTTFLMIALGKWVHLDPSVIITMFAKEGDAKKFEKEKLVPVIDATPVLGNLIDTSRSSTNGNTWDFKRFSGGFLKLIKSGSPGDVKSTSAPRVAIEEPDDAVANLKGQGNTIKLLIERTKSYDWPKILYGGTPSVAGMSNVDDAYEGSDKREYHVPCHECGESHVLDFDNLLCGEYKEGYQHKKTGVLDPSTAYYSCPYCGVIWTDLQKNRNVKKGKWIATELFQGTAGFKFNELMSPFPGSKFAKIKKKELEAKWKLEQGDDTDWIAFVNNSMGMAYEYGSDAPEEDDLKAKALDYPEMQIPNDGLVLTAGVDLQHDRFAVTIRAWGRNGASWLVYWGELYGEVTVKNSPVWQHLDQLLFTPIPHESGARLPISAFSMDASDGATSDLVYAYIASKKSSHALAIKGASEQSTEKEIFTTPARKSKYKKRTTKADKYGISVYIVGTNKAKDEIHRKLRLKGDVPDRHYYYKTVRDDYYAQLLSEVKAPSRMNRRKKVWQQRSGKRNEGLDCEVYTLHASRYLRLHLWTERKWMQQEINIKQVGMFTQNEPSGHDNQQNQPKKQQQAQQPRRNVYGGV
jgi:phage terminase large subunit GpA-like protein